MPREWISGSVILFLLIACGQPLQDVKGVEVETQLLSDYNISRDYSNSNTLQKILDDINCSVSSVVHKKLVVADSFTPRDTSRILLVPFISNGHVFKSSAYADVTNRFILINLRYIREFATKNTLNDTTAFVPLVELMLLHEIGHFMLHAAGSFDNLDSGVSTLGQQENPSTTPEYLTTVKKIELSADSLAIDLIRKQLKSQHYECLNIAFDVERLLPGMQFQLSGTRMIEKFGARDVNFLHDPSNDHPNMELRVTFMNYFLFPSDAQKKMIDDYIYDRTVAPVHEQELDPKIFQGKTKNLPESTK